MTALCDFYPLQRTLPKVRHTIACFLKMLFSVLDIYGNVGVLSKDRSVLKGSLTLLKYSCRGRGRQTEISDLSEMRGGWPPA